jgi:hypothetical protein
MWQPLHNSIVGFQLSPELSTIEAFARYSGELDRDQQMTLAQGIANVRSALINSLSSLGSTGSASGVCNINLVFCNSFFFKKNHYVMLVNIGLSLGKCIICFHGRT